MIKVNNKTIYFSSLRASVLETSIVPLVSHFKKNNISVKFIHANSVLDHKRYSAENISALDLWSSDLCGILKSLKESNPLSMVCYGHLSVFDIMVVMIAHELKILCIYMDHGIPIEGIGDRYHFTLRKGIIRNFKLFILFTRSFLLLRSNIFEKYLTLFRIIISNKYPINWHDHAIFYSKYTRDWLSQKIKYDESSVEYSGLTLVQPSKEEGIKYPGKCSKIALFIHQPVIYDGISNISYQDECAFYKDYFTIFNENDYKVIFKIHPRESLSQYKDTYQESSIIITDQALSELLGRADIIVGHFSTVLFSAIALKKKVVILKYPGTLLKMYNIFQELPMFDPSRDELRLVLSESQVFPEIDDYAYLKKYVGNNESYQKKYQAITRASNRRI